MTDEEWLLQRRPRATQNEIESFAERVSIMLESFINYTGTQEIIARGNALSDLNRKNNINGDL